VTVFERLQASHHARPSPEGNDRDARSPTGAEDGLDAGGIGRSKHRIGRVLE
jgi:hypothetical protein